MAKTQIPVRGIGGGEQCHLVTSNYCFEGFADAYSSGRGAVFASGPKTWRGLAERGYWVNGSSDGLGHGKVAHYLKSQALEVLHGAPLPLAIYTAEGATPEGGEVVACYRRWPQQVGPEYSQQLQGIRSFFWASYPQYELFRQRFPHIPWERDRWHCCGMGKTFQEFKKHNIKVTPFIDWEHFMQTCMGNS